MSINQEENQKDLNLERFLSFKLGNETYAFPVGVVREVLDKADLTAIPRTTSYMKGVFNLRGLVIPVIDIRLLFSLMGSDTNELHHDSMIVADVLDKNGITVVGILANSVEEVIELSRNNIESGDRLSHAEFVKEIGKKDNKFILILDINSIVSHVDAEIEQLVKVAE